MVLSTAAGNGGGVMTAEDPAGRAIPDGVYLSAAARPAATEVRVAIAATEDQMNRRVVMPV